MATRTAGNGAFFALLFVLFFSSSAGANPELNEWASKQLDYSKRYLFENISPRGAAAGAVVASPSKSNPDYFFHWIRDAALTMDVVVDIYQNAGPSDQSRYFWILSDFIHFSRRNQQTPNPSGDLGEPKFNADGSAFTGSWGRPQNDGPALRAITLTRLAMLWLAEGREALVREKLYRAEIPAYTVIKADLEFVSHHWRETCFDLWEESRGHHFYTEMVQRRALIEGATLADRMGDGAAAAWYRKQASELESAISRHWDDSRRIINATLDRDGGVDYKYSGLDAGTILGVMHGNTNDGFFGVNDSRVMATAKAIENVFERIYYINHVGFPGVAIGRYPEDRYDGGSSSGQGNPWVLLTAGFGEYYYRLATELETVGKLKVDRLNLEFLRSLEPTLGWSTKQTISRNDSKFDQVLRSLRQRGDDFMDRVRIHGPGEGHFSEQLNRDSGVMQSARDLTWNYASLLTALWQRN